MGPDLMALRNLCPDPMHLFILCPSLLRTRDLVLMYIEDPSETLTFAQEVRARMVRERWNEHRSVFQAKRFAARQDAVVEAEATVMACMAVDYHVMRLRGMMVRWQDLASHVEEQLARCANGERPFTPDMRDACKELREVEARLDEIMPKMGVEERAARQLTQSRERREDLIEAVGRQLTSLRGADASRNVLRLVRGGEDEEAV